MQSDEPPIPPRYWWLKRIGAATVLVLLALVLLRVWWGWEAQRRWDSQLAQYRTRGEPVDREDFTPPPLPDAENAAYFLTKAAEALVQPDGVTLTADDIFGNPELVAQFPQEARRLVEANLPALERVREANSLSQATWNIQIPRPAIDTLLPHLGKQRALAKHLFAAAILDHQSGEDESAIGSIRETLVLGEWLRVHPAPVIAYLVRVAISGVVVHAVEVIAPDLAIIETNWINTDRCSASREAVEGLIRQLLEEQQFREGWRRAMHAERFIQFDTVDWLLSTPTSNGFVVELLLPAWRFDSVRLLTAATPAAQALEPESYQQGRLFLGTENDPYYDLEGLKLTAHLLSVSFWPTFDRAARTVFQCLAQRRMAATALAIRLYEIDHGGRPATLDHLVPDYLPAVPLDPFAADGRALGYLPDADPPVLYSVDADGIDDMGEFDLEPDGDVAPDSPDFVFFLNGTRPRSAPTYPREEESAAEAVDDRHEEENDDGESDEGDAGGEQP